MEVWEYQHGIYINAEIPNDENGLRLVNNEPLQRTRRTFAELSEREQEARLHKMKNHRLKAKHQLERIIDCNACPKTSFLTLTVEENVTDREMFNSMFKSFIKRFNWNVYGTKKSKLKYVACLERQKRGAWHAHLLMFNVPFIPLEQLRTIWSHGSVHIINLKHLDDVANTGRYVSKYMEKGIGQELLESFGKKSYYASRNLKRPTEIKTRNSANFEIDETKIMYENSYTSKIFLGGELIDNPVKYKKIKI